MLEVNPCQDKVKVAIRVRPFNRREIDLKTKCSVEVKGDQTILHYIPVPPTTASPSKDKFSNNNSPKNDAHLYRPPKVFTFDHCFWSFQKSDSEYASQEDVFNALGYSVLDSAFQGYNACIFAYGQTGSGKSYTMMGSQNERGLIPRLCDAIFDRIRTETEAEPRSSFKLEVSYMEIYNEKVHDLLEPSGTRQSLKVREHNILGPYVDGLSILAVSSYEEIETLMEEGNKSRTVAATNMNSESSRSHAVFTLKLTCSIYEPIADVYGERVSKMSLVDLAGSERAVKTGASGDRLKEGSNINKSLTTLGLVISKLADQASGKKKNNDFVPYRDSVLTWLLKDNLGGNSKTIMISTISPAADNYEETLSTLRYADRAKRIVNHAIINEDPNNKIIRELQIEVEQLREKLKTATVQTQPDKELQERLVESEKLIKQMEQTWEEKLRKTETIHRERAANLEKMGISVQSSGIAVEKDGYYLVNLSADPSMNALLVYYLKQRTLIGRAEAAVEQDIQLSGVGILAEHAIIEIDPDKQEIFMEPLNGSKTYVNGVLIKERVKIHKGDRILWGHNHFFSLNCPGSKRDSQEMPDPGCFDYAFARDELLLNSLNPGFEQAIYAMERQFEDPRRMQFGSNMTLSQSSKYGGSINRFSGSNMNLSAGSNGACSPLSAHIYAQKNAIQREERIKRELSKLREEIANANKLAYEANLIAEEMKKRTEYKVTLQIPARNLSPNRLRSGILVSEPAILVRRRGKSNSNLMQQIWSMEKFDNALIDMRELYQRWKESEDDSGSQYSADQYSVTSDDISAPTTPELRRNDPFFERQESHLLIGVANVFLEVLFHDAELDYDVPIISQQGEVVGRLGVQFSRIEGQIGEREGDASSDIESGHGSEDAGDDVHDSNMMTSSTTKMFITNTSGSGSLSSEDKNQIESSKALKLNRNQIRVRLRLKKVSGLPPALSNFVFAQYSMWDYPEMIVVPGLAEEEEINCDSPASSPPTSPRYFNFNAQQESEKVFKFNDEREFVITLSDEFLERCDGGALPIEVWGHRISALRAGSEMFEEEQGRICRSLSDRWSELKRRVEFCVQIHELNEDGRYVPVEVVPEPDTNKVSTGGIYQLKQGQQKRVAILVRPLSGTGTLPIIIDRLSWIAMGCVVERSKTMPPLDSYQDDDLQNLQTKWHDILTKRQEYLNAKFKELMLKRDKTEEEIERENQLVGQLMSLVEESQAAKCPIPNSGIPGAPHSSKHKPKPGMELYQPVIFFDLETDDINFRANSNTLIVAGEHSILRKEHNTSYISLPIIRVDNNDELRAVASWDSSIHNSIALNRATPSSDKIFLIVKICLHLSHPVPMELVLRKRIAVNIYTKQSITKNLFKRISRYEQPTLDATGVTYELVSSIPKASEDIEDRESLALLAASDLDLTACDGESYIERYTKSISAVESILALDRLRQEVAIREQQAKKHKLAQRQERTEAGLRKTYSTPNMAPIMNGMNRHSMNIDPIQEIEPPKPRPVTQTFDLNSAADLVKQKVSSLFGSMGGLNYISEDSGSSSKSATSKANNRQIPEPTANLHQVDEVEEEVDEEVRELTNSTRKHLQIDTPTSLSTSSSSGYDPGNSLSQTTPLSATSSEQELETGEDIREDKVVIQFGNSTMISNNLK